MIFDILIMIVNLMIKIANTMIKIVDATIKFLETIGENPRLYFDFPKYFKAVEIAIEMKKLSFSKFIIQELRKRNSILDFKK